LFTLQDYDSAIEFPLFTEDYQKFKHLLEPGAVLYIKGNMQKRWNSEEFQLSLKEVRQLDSIGKEMTNSITIRLPLERITKELIDDVDNLCKTHKGQHKLKMVFIDKANQVSLDLLAPDIEVNADSDFINELERIGLRYKVN
jgi:DNA polymerase-3 subunit alpha